MYIGQMLLLVLRIFSFLIVIRIVISFIPLRNLNQTWRQLLSFLYELTEPFLAPIRRYLPQNNLGVDFSPLLLFFIIYLLQSLIVTIFY